MLSGPAAIAARLEYLTDTMHAAGRDPLSDAQIAEAVSSGTTMTGEQSGAAVPLSVADLAALRAGRPTDTTDAQLAALAAYFGVPVEYFYDDEAAAALHQQLRLLKLVRETGVRQVGLYDDNALSAESLIAILEAVQRDQSD